MQCADVEKLIKNGYLLKTLLAVKTGVLKPKYTLNEFSLCRQKLLTNDHGNTEKKSFITRSIKKSEFGGQVFIRRNCAFSRKTIRNATAEGTVVFNEKSNNIYIDNYVSRSSLIMMIL